jgi:integrase
MTPWCSVTKKVGTGTRSGSGGRSSQPSASAPRAWVTVRVIAIHDLRHTHATLPPADREPVKTVSERLGHASITVTLAVYGHVMPGDQKRAADRFAALIGEA